MIFFDKIEDFVKINFVVKLMQIYTQMSYRNLGQLIGKLEVCIFCQVKQKHKNLDVKVAADKKFSILFSTIAIMATPVADRSLPDNAAGFVVAELQVDDKPENSNM